MCADLVPREAVQAWLKHLRMELPTVAFKASTSGTRGKLTASTAIKAAAATTSGECLGADMLIQLLKNYSRSHKIKKAITVGIVGYPNVGKSSIINSLKRSQAVGVSSTAGFTKVIQEIKLDKKIVLLDSPGILFAAESDPDNVLRNCVNVEQLTDVITPVESIIRRCRKEQLLKAYQVADFKDSQEFLNHIAKKKGKMRKGGIVDLQAAACTVLQDWNNGKVPFFTMPPQQKNTTTSSELVTTWAKEFDIDNIPQDQILASLDPTSGQDSMMMETVVNDGSLDYNFMGDDEDDDMEDNESGEDDDDMQEDSGDEGKLEMAV